MATILTKKSDTASSVPTAGALTNSTGGAEIAVNTADKRLFTKDSGGSVVELGTNPSSLSLPNGTANAVPYLNGSKVLTSGSALTFDGTTFTLGANGSFTSAYSGNGLVLSKTNVGSKNAIVSVADTSSVLLINNSAAGWDSVAMYAAGSEQMRLTSTGLGIGTSSPGVKLDVYGSDPRIQSYNSSGPKNIMLAGSTAGYTGMTTNHPLVFITNDTERMRLDSSGNLLVGATTYEGSSTSGASSVYLGASGFISANVTDDFGMQVNRTGTNGVLFNFRKNGSDIGNISTNGTTVSYNTSSDYRLKNTIAPMTGALAKVAALKPCTYKWNADGSDGEGFIAHELAEVCPQAVSGEKDAVDAEGNPKYQGIDTSFLVATLTAAIQELKAEFDAYKASHP